MVLTSDQTTVSNMTDEYAGEEVLDFTGEIIHILTIKKQKKFITFISKMEEM